jgi:aspartate/methionine/tyrosine aminotransferase
MLSEIEGVSLLKPEGAFYAFPNFSGLLDRSFAGRVASTTVDLAQILLEEISVAFVPGEAFGAPGYARFSFALGDEDLKEGTQRIADFLKG